jgi:hypothetical protein
MKPHLAAAILLLAAGTPPMAAAQTFHGTLLDRATGEPLASAVVEALDARGQVVRRVRTDARGGFELPLPGPGSYRLHAAHLGYAPATSAEVRVEAREDVEVRFRLSHTVMLMEPVTIIGHAARRLAPHPFHERRAQIRRTGHGRFVDREEIERRRPPRLTEVFRTVPGVRVSPHPQRSGRWVLSMRGGCVPTVWVDGRTNRVLGDEVDLFVIPEHVEGIEIYSLSGVPGEFFDPQNPNCGVVVIWTRLS